MKVRITFVDDESLLVEPLLGAGGGGSLGGGDIPGAAQFAATVKAGQNYRGWKYSRLRRLGEGEHDLFHKDDPQKNPPLVIQGNGGGLVNPPQKRVP